jgi:hypothetical protein
MVTDDLTPVTTPGYEHPSFTKAKALPEPWRSRFPKSVEEANAFEPFVTRYALAHDVLVVMRSRIECAWAAYCGAVPGHDHDVEQEEILREGTKLPEKIARVIFPQFKDIPYAH